MAFSLISAGKTTILNALLGDEIIGRAVPRTTAGVNFFRVGQSSKQNASESVEIREADGSSIVDDEESSESVKETTFDVQVRRLICKMRKNTQLVLIDIPSISRAEPSMKYKKYIESNWKTFHCVVVVLDAVQGVNAQEQVDLLKFVQKNHQDSKDVPIIIVGNKMDDLDDDDTINQIKETRAKTVEIFGNVDCQFVPTKAIYTDQIEGNPPKSIDNKPMNTAFIPSNNAYLYVDEMRVKSIEIFGSKLILQGDKASCWFIPLCAKNSLVYVRAGSLTLEQVCEPNWKGSLTLKHACGPDVKDLVDKIGSDEYSNWDRMAWDSRSYFGDSKSAVMERLLRDSSILFEKRLKDSNYSFFLASLSDCITRQLDIISEQIDAQLSKKRPPVYDNTATFWIWYEEYEAKIFDDLDMEVCPRSFEEPFVALASQYNGPLQTESRYTRLAQLVREQLVFLLTKLENWSFVNYCMASGGKHHRWETFCPPDAGLHYDTIRWDNGWIVPETMTWESLSPHEWITILNSISLVWNERCFLQDFGPQKVALNGFLMSLHGVFASISGICLNGEAENSKYIPDCLAAYRKQIHNGKLKSRITMPDTVNDPSHWGFLSWKYIELKRSLSM